MAGNNYGWRFDWLTPDGMVKPFSVLPSAVNERAYCERVTTLAQQLAHGPAPSRRCCCGIHLVKQVDDLMPWVERMMKVRATQGDPFEFVGVVSRWQVFGAVIPGEYMGEAGPGRDRGRGFADLSDPPGTIRVQRTRLVGPMFADFTAEHEEVRGPLVMDYAKFGVELLTAARPMFKTVPGMWRGMR